MNEKIKVGFCVAYDWYLLNYALPLIYKEADVICLSIDVNRVSWSGQKYSFDADGFNKLILLIDHQQKIKILQEDFSLRHLTPMQNEVRQRNRMAEFMGSGGWHIQLDCDEYFLKFPAFAQYLLAMPTYQTKKVNVCCAWVILYKEISNGFLVVSPKRKENLYFIQVATKDPSYEYGRRNGNFNIYTPYYILHQSWARSENEIQEKVQNWGHSGDFDSNAYLERWKQINDTNFDQVRDFHPTIPSAFPALRLIKGKSMKEVIENFNESEILSLSKFDFLVKNSKLVSRLMKGFSMLRSWVSK